MRAAEIDYDIPPSIPGDPPVTISVNWGIEFEEAERHCLIIKAHALTVQVMVGGFPVGESDVSKCLSGMLREWLDLRAKDMTFESIGYTEAEALREYLEEEEDRREETDQIGRAA